MAAVAKRGAAVLRPTNKHSPRRQLRGGLKPACTKARQRLFSAFPGWGAPLAGNSLLTAEWGVRASRRLPILALGTGNRPGPLRERGSYSSREVNMANLISKVTRVKGSKALISSRTIHIVAGAILFSFGITLLT